MKTSQLGKITTKVVLTIFFLFSFVSILSSPIFAEASNKSTKAIILVLDQIGIQDLVEADTPNIDVLIENGGLGIMNVRPEAIINKNRASSYLTLGMGTRITAPEKNSWNLVKNASGSWHLEDFETLKAGISGEKLERLGFIGKTAQSRGLKVGLIGQADTNSSVGALLAMDDKGKIPFYQPEAKSLTDAELDVLIKTTDILFVDFAETVLANKQSNDHIIKAIEDADQFLGKILKRAGLEENLYMVITPNPSVDGFRNLNLALTPVVVTSPINIEKNGLLTSSSTKREGLVTNLNFVPTLFAFFGIDDLGETIVVNKKAEFKTEILVKNENLYLNLNKTRYLLHGTYIFLIMFFLASSFTEKLAVWKKETLVKWLSVIIVTVPLASMIAPLAIDYSQVFVGHLLIIIVAILITWLVLSIRKSYLSAIGWVCLMTSMVILLDTFSRANYLLDTPFGFNDVIIGGRFYGINNDLMGILIGTTVIGFFWLGERYRLEKSTLTILGLALTFMTVVALSPSFGANIGGTIGASVVMVLTIMIALDQRISLKRLILILIVVFSVEIGIAALDAAINKEITHAGRLFSSVMTNGLGVFFQMIQIKIKQVLLMLVLPPWNFVLFFQSYLLWQLLIREKTRIEKLKKSYPVVYKGFKTTIIGSFVIFVFNDTGVISSAIMLTYLLVPLGYLLNFEKK